MPRRPAPPGPGWDEDPAWEPGVPNRAAGNPDAEADWLAWCEAAAAEGEPLDPDEEESGAAAAGRAPEPGGGIRQRDAAGHDARVRGAGRVRGRGGGRGRPVPGRFRR